MSVKNYDAARPKIPAELERMVKTEAGHKCAIKWCSEHTYLEIHHINENREDNRIDNLILLCDKHHKMSHADAIDRKSLKIYKQFLHMDNHGSLLERFNKLESMLEESGAIPKHGKEAYKAINIILEEAVLLGRNLRGTQKGNSVAQQIFDLLRAHGDQMNVDSIVLMVRRDDSYSRVGLSGLGILYDKFFEHVKSLNLIDYFESENFPALAYYCALRENFPGEQDMSACLMSPKFKHGGFKVVDNDFDLLDKYANRGSSAVLDFLVYEGAPIKSNDQEPSPRGS